MRYLFEDYALDTAKCELRRNGLIVPAAPQAFDLLAYLIQHRDRIVTKDDLAAGVWERRAITDSALTTRLNVVRHVVGDSGENQRLIRTFPRKGFRFVGAVREDRGLAGSHDEAAGELPSIAVLPFVNLSGDPAQDFFGDVIADELLTELVRLRWLLVIARNSSFGYKGRSIDVRKIGADLDVGYVLEGGARHSNGRVRVTCRLVDAKTARQVWSSRYDFHFVDGFQILDEITEALVAHIAPAILDAERNRIARLPPDKLSVWEAYQRGIAQMLKHTVDGCVSARAFFQQAVALKPDYSPGFDGLAWSHLVEASAFGRLPLEEAGHLGERLARKALEFDPDNASARARLALTLHMKGDSPAAIEETDAALAVSPNCADAHGARGAALIFCDRPGEGRAAIEKFLRLSPRDPARPIRLSQLAAAYYFEADYENAVRVARQAVRDYPAVPMAYRWMAASLGQLGLVAEGAQVVDTLRQRFAPSLAMYVSRPPLYFHRREHEHLLEGLAKAGWRGV